MKEFGFIRLDRSIENWRWFKDVKTCHLFVHLILMANYCDAEFESRDIKRGQIVTSLNNLCQQCGLTFQELRTALNHLKSTKDITIESTTKYTIITVNDYEKYAASTYTPTNNQQTANKQTTNEQQQYNKYNKYNKNNKYSYDESEIPESVRIFESKSLFKD